MFLCEEYIKRHKLDIDFIKHVNWGCLFYQTMPGQWKVLTISWKEPANHPGYYLLNQLQPIKFNLSDGQFFKKNNETVFYVDDYEKLIYENTKDIIRCPKNEDEIINAAWEIGLYIFDSLIAKQVSSYVCNLGGDLREFNDFMQWLVNKVPEFHKFWHGEMSLYVDSHLNWLSYLIHKRNVIQL